MDSVLELRDVETCYGLSQVLFGVSLTIAPGEMVTLMGRNGMGKDPDGALDHGPGLGAQRASSASPAARSAASRPTRSPK